MDTKIIEKLSKLTGFDARRVFEKLCDYIIGFFDPCGTPVEGWTFNSDINKEFQVAMGALVKEYQEGINERGWCDPLGSTFEAILGKFDASKSGQFFTPESVCNLMAEILADKDKEATKVDCGAFGWRTIASDPSAGSGRILLAVASKYVGKPRKELPYFIAEDIGPLCCKMSAINLMMHGLPGEAVCHDTLSEPHTCRFGYVINETTFPMYTGIPSIRKFTDARRFVTFKHRSSVK